MMFVDSKYVQSWPKELVLGCENFSNLCVTESK